MLRTPHDGLPIHLDTTSITYIHRLHYIRLQVSAHPALVGFLGVLRTAVEDFIEVMQSSNILEEEEHHATAAYIVYEVPPTYYILHTTFSLLLTCYLRVSRCCRRSSSFTSTTTSPAARRAAAAAAAAAKRPARGTKTRASARTISDRSWRSSF